MVVCKTYIGSDRCEILTAQNNTVTAEAFQQVLLVDSSIICGAGCRSSGLLRSLYWCLFPMIRDSLSLSGCTEILANKYRHKPRSDPKV
jgi:hypothetical protein